MEKGYNLRTEMLQTMRSKLLWLIIGMISFGCASDDPLDIIGPGDGIVGVAGSTSRFVINDNYLYIVTETDLKVIELEANGQSSLVRSMPAVDVLETIFIYGDYLFLGAQEGVYIYDISEPDLPSYISKYVHQTACDPIIASGGFAYLTLRDGTNCRNQSENFLITLDISDIGQPVAVDTIVMSRPRGLGIYNGDLYVGEGIYGLKKFDISTPYEPKLDTFYTDIPCNDLIGLSSHLIITYNHAISQFLVDSDTLTELSIIQ